MKSIHRTILAALTCAAISLGVVSVSNTAHADSDISIQFESGGIQIEIGNGHHRRHHKRCGNPCGNNYPQPVPFIDTVVYETVGGWQDEVRTDCCGRRYFTGNQIWVERQVARNVRAFWDAPSGRYWYVDRHGNNQVVN